MCGAAAFVDCGRCTTHKCYNHIVVMLTIRDGPAGIDVKARHYANIATSCPRYRGPHWTIAIMYVWYGKTRIVWLPYGEKFLKICLFVSAEYTNVTDKQTDRWTTPHNRFLQRDRQTHERQ